MDIIYFDYEKYDLKRLLDAKHPFLERFRISAPGTFKHCQNVSSLCEAVALEMDLNPDLMRVIGLFHDVGKIVYPECFLENQKEVNIHNNLDPMVSFYLLSKHVSDSALILLQMDDFPNELILPIVQHHGNSVLRSLANKANGDKDSFRYRETCAPTTIEAAILMICDSVEATIRSIEISSNSSSLEVEKIREVIMNTLDRLEEDDQLDEVKVGDLKRIKSSLQRDLVSKYHKRDSRVYEKKPKNECQYHMKK